MLGLVIVFSGLLYLAKVKLAVTEDPRVAEVLEALPGANCGGCGLAGCADFAKAVVEGRADVSACTVGGAKVAERIAAVLGIEAGRTYPHRPVIHCAAKADSRPAWPPYEGVQGCVEANVIGVTQACTYGCLGFGDCVRSCRYDALHMMDGLPEVDYDKCTGCGACAKACPRNLIELIPFKHARMLVVACSNKEPGKMVKQVCKVGCIGCGACQRLFPDLFEVTENLACLDYDDYSGQEDVDRVIEKCPTGTLIYRGEPTLRSEDILSKGEMGPHMRP